jgi:hypothetical protein
MHRLKNLAFWAESKNQYVCLFFCAKPTVLAVLAGFAGQ